MDFDGDFCFLTKNPTLLDAYKPKNKEYIVYNDGSGPKPKKAVFNQENFKDYVSKTLEKDRIGIIINYTTFMKDLLMDKAKLKEVYKLKTVEQVQAKTVELVKNLIRLTTTSELEIDKAKTGIEPALEKEWLVKFAPSWMEVAESDELEVYESNSLLGKVNRDVREFQKRYVETWADDFKSYDFSRDFMKYCSIDSNKVVELRNTVKKIKAQYGKEIYGISQREISDKERRVLIGEVVEFYKEELNKLNFDKRTIAYLAYSVSREDASSTSSFCWACAFDGLLMLLHEASKKEETSLASVLVPLRISDSSVESIVVEDKKFEHDGNIVKVLLPDGEYEVYYERYNKKCYAVVAFENETVVEVTQDSFRAKLNFKYSDYTATEAFEILSNAMSITFDTVTQNGGEYIACFADGKRVGNIMKSAQSDVLNFSIIEEDLLKYAKHYNFVCDGLSDVKANTLVTKTGSDSPVAIFDFVVDVASAKEVSKEILDKYAKISTPIKREDVEEMYAQTQSYLEDEFFQEPVDIDYDAQYDCYEEAMAYQHQQ